MILENTIVGNADDSTLLAELSKPRNRMSVVLSISCDLAHIGNWCICWDMLVNHIMMKALIVSRARMLAPIYRQLLMDGIVAKRVTELEVLGVISDTKISFENHLRSGL